MTAKVLEELSDNRNLLFSVIALGVAALMVTVVYGVDSVIPGAHDVFHDFRHSIGIQCH